MELYNYKYKNYNYSQNGFDKKIAYDRYSVNEINFKKFKVNDTVLYRKQIKEELLIGKITEVYETSFKVKNSESGEEDVIHYTLISKPLEKTPYKMWNRWSEALTSMETSDYNKWRNEYRWLFDGFKFSPGGRVMLALGQEYTLIPDEKIEESFNNNTKSTPSKDKASLTLYNCFVGKNTKGVVDSISDDKYVFYKNIDTITDTDKAKLQFKYCIDSIYEETEVMKHGGGYGLNISNINTIISPKISKEDLVFYVPDDDEIYTSMSLGKLGKYSTVVADENILNEKYSHYVHLSIEDNIPSLIYSIYEMISNLYDGKKLVIRFDNVRKRGELVKSINGRSSGRTSWVELYESFANMLTNETIDAIDISEAYSKLVNIIEQGGSRRGSLLLLLNTYRLDIIDKFVNRKKERTEETNTGKWLTGCNISLGIDNKFINIVSNCLKKREEFFKKSMNIHSPLESNKDYNKFNELFINHCESLLDFEKQIFSIFVSMINASYDSAEPGVIFIERYNEMSNSYYYNEIVCTNPCAEQGLPELGCCNLSHIVLPMFYDETTKEVNYTDLERVVKMGMRAQDQYIDYSHYFLEENKINQENERRIGQGTIGIGALLIKLKLKYGSEECNKFLDQLYARISFWQFQASVELSKEKGSFKKYDYEKFLNSKHVQRLISGWKEILPQDDFNVDLLLADLKQYGIRNVCHSTQAPTGSTGTMLNSYYEHNAKESLTTGIEPFYSFKYFRASRIGLVEETVGIVETYMKENNISDINLLPDYFTTAMKLTPQEHINVQKIIQKWTDSSISKTINCPNNISLNEVEKLFLNAYSSGLKGISIYRDGSRGSQVLSEVKENAMIEDHIETKYNKRALKKCPNCGKTAYQKENCICLACNTSVCSL